MRITQILLNLFITPPPPAAHPESGAGQWLFPSSMHVKIQKYVLENYLTVMGGRGLCTSRLGMTQSDVIFFFFFKSNTVSLNSASSRCSLQMAKLVDKCLFFFQE